MPKLQNIVILRSFAILAVVLYHCYCPWLDAWNWFSCDCRKVYSFIFEVALVGRMPLFVFVSGYLFSHLIIDRGKYKTFWAFLNNKFKRLLIPCFTFSAIMSLALCSNYINIIVWSGYHLWFLKMLFWCFITGWILNRYVKSLYGKIITMMITIIMMGCKMPEIIGIGQYCKYFAFFYSGYLVYAYRLTLEFLFKGRFLYMFIFFYFLLLGVALVQYYNSDLINDIIHRNTIIVGIRYLLRPLSVLIAFGLVETYLRKKTKISKWFSQLNEISYGIYLTHMLLLQCLNKYFLDSIQNYASLHYIITPIILFISVTAMCILVCKWLKNYQWSRWIIG